MQSEDDLKRNIEEYFGFKRELIQDVESCGLWHVRFTVNDIRYYGWVAYHGAVPQLSVAGYTTKYYWHKTPVTEEYYKKFIEGQCIRLVHYVNMESQDGDWEWQDRTFDNPEEAEEYIAGLNNPGEYTYEIYVDGIYE